MHRLIIASLLLVVVVSLVSGADLTTDGLSAGSGCGPISTSVIIPLSLSGVKEPLGNMDIILTNDPSIDARIILQYSVGLCSATNPTLIVRSDETTVRSIMDAQEPAKTFFACV